MDVLYFHPLSLGARAVLILANELSMTVDLRLEPDWERRGDFLALSPEGRVPVLVHKGQHILSGALPIMEFWLEQADAPNLIGATALDRAEVRRLALWFLVRFDEEVANALISEKVVKRLFQRQTPDTSILRAAHYNLRNHLRYVDYLADRRHYLAGERISLADLVAAAALSLIDYMGDIAWPDYLSAKNWYMRLKSRKSVRACLNQRLSGVNPPDHYVQPDF